MAKINFRVFDDPTLAAMKANLAERMNSEPPRKYIGGSGIGSECSRKIWYGLQGLKQLPMQPKSCMAIEDGHRTEALMAERLRLVPGVELWTNDESGEQFGFDWGFMKGHLDGVIVGLLQAPKTPHVWENKAVNETKFAKFMQLLWDFDEKMVLRQWDAEYYAQAVIYMDAMDLTRHYMTVTTPGGREVASCRTEANPTYAKALIQKAKRIYEAKEPPERIGKPDYWYCKHMCGHYLTCHGRMPE